MDQLAAMRAFVAVARQEGFAPAARVLGQSTTSVSRKIADLERHLGVNLFVRSTRHVRLSEAGARYLSRAAEILRALERLDDDVAAAGGALSGPLRVTAPPISGSDILGPVFIAFATLHPAVVVEAHFTERLVDLVGEGFDVALRMGTLEDSALLTKRIVELPYALCASPAYLARRGRPDRPSALVEHDAVHWRSPRQAQQWRFARGDEVVAVTPPARMSTDDPRTRRDAVSAGLGLALLPLAGVGEALAEGSLETVLPEWRPLDFDLHFVRPASGPPSAKARAFMSFVERSLAERAADAQALAPTPRRGSARDGAVSSTAP